MGTLGSGRRIESAAARPAFALFLLRSNELPERNAKIVRDVYEEGRHKLAEMVGDEVSADFYLEEAVKRHTQKFRKEKKSGRKVHRMEDVQTAEKVVLEAPEKQEEIQEAPETQPVAEPEKVDESQQETAEAEKPKRHYKKRAPKAKLEDDAEADNTQPTGPSEVEKELCAVKTLLPNYDEAHLLMDLVVNQHHGAEDYRQQEIEQILKHMYETQSEDFKIARRRYTEAAKKIDELNRLFDKLNDIAVYQASGSVTG